MLPGKGRGQPEGGEGLLPPLAAQTTALRPPTIQCFQMEFPARPASRQYLLDLSQSSVICNVLLSPAAAEVAASSPSRRPLPLLPKLNLLLPSSFLLSVLHSLLALSLGPTATS